MTGRRGVANRLGFAVQLALLRHPGMGLAQIEEPVDAFVAWLAAQLGVPIAAFSQYAGLSLGSPRRIRRLHSPEHLGGHGKLLCGPNTHFDFADCGAAGASASQNLSAGRWLRPSSGFVPAVVCDDFVFVAGQMAHNAGRGLAPRAHVPDHSAWAGTEIRKQTEFLILGKLKPALEAAGSSLQQSLKAQIYLSRVNGFLDVWNQYYAMIPCALTLVPTKSFAMVGGIIEINLLALTNAASRRKQVVKADIPGMAAYGPCVRTGEFLLPSGLMAIGHNGHVVGESVSPGFAALSHAGYTQAATVFDYAEALRRAAGATLANMLRAQYFVSDLTAFPGISIAWSARLGTHPHPFVCIQTPPAMPAPGMMLIADSGLLFSSAVKEPRMPVMMPS